MGTWALGQGASQVRVVRAPSTPLAGKRLNIIRAAKAPLPRHLGICQQAAGGLKSAYVCYTPVGQVMVHEVSALPEQGSRPEALLVFCIFETFPESCRLLNVGD